MAAVAGKRTRLVSIDESSKNESRKQTKQESDTPSTALEALSKFTVVVADTGEFEAIKKYSPQDATTNPSLILKAALLPEYQFLVDDAVAFGLKFDGNCFDDKVDAAMDMLAVYFGKKIAQEVPGFVSTEVDARLSFDTDATVARARRIISMYEQEGVDKSHILIKIASTYEGIRAGEILQKEGVNCNLTLLFSLIQAAACAEAGIKLISPFVGRIMDWHKAKTGITYTGSEDPGVISVKNIYNYFKTFEYTTIVMGASFRNIGEILNLAGCDRLTIAPSLLEELKNSTADVPRILGPTAEGAEYKGAKVLTDEKSFRFSLNADAMATEKLAEGIRGFCVDIEKLENIIKGKMTEQMSNDH